MNTESSTSWTPPSRTSAPCSTACVPCATHASALLSPLALTCAPRSFPYLLLCYATLQIDYLAKFGFTRDQAYLLLSCCPCEGRISGIVDIPNAVATLALPLAIFDVDIRPKRTPGAPPVPGQPVLKRLPNVCKCDYRGTLPTFQNPSAKYDQ